MTHTAAPDTASAVRYTVRKGAGATVRIQKWRLGEGKVGTYFVEPQGWWQQCTCPARTVCKHVRLINLIDSGRLGTGPYVWDGKRWGVAGHGAVTPQPAAIAVQS